jgi:hypothetical protein
MVLPYLLPAQDCPYDTVEMEPTEVGLKCCWCNHEIFAESNSECACDNCKKAETAQ